MKLAPPRSPAAVPPVRAWPQAIRIGALSGAPRGVPADASRTGARRAADFPRIAPAIAVAAPAPGDACRLGPGRPVARALPPVCRIGARAESAGPDEVRAPRALPPAGRAPRPRGAGGRPRVAA